MAKETPMAGRGVPAGFLQYTPDAKAEKFDDLRRTGKLRAERAEAEVKRLLGLLDRNGRKPDR